MRVLVVDDDASVRAVARTALDDAEVVEAADGAAALETLHVLTCEVVLLDLMLPRVDGFATLSSIRGQHGDAPAVVVITGRAAELDHVAAYRLGADDYLVKPFDVDELAETVRRLAGMDRAARLAERRDRLAQAEFLQRLDQGFGAAPR